MTVRDIFPTDSLLIGTSTYSYHLQMAWQTRLDNLDLTQQEKVEAEVLIPQRYTTLDERNLFLRGSDNNAIRRVRALLAGGWP